MSDLISRQVAIDALKNERSDWNCDYNVPVDHCIDAIYSVPSAQPAPQWIPVTERLPEIKQRVLITYNTEDGLKTDVTWYDKYGFLLSGDVIAWMPMVKPYKEESGE